MRILLQRVTQSSVAIQGDTSASDESRTTGSRTIVGAISNGLLALIGFTHGDNENIAQTMIAKALSLRIFADPQGKMNQDLVTAKGSLLLVPQFTLYAGCKNGRRPDFGKAMAPTEAQSLFNYTLAHAQSLGIPVECGQFGALMEVALINHGPVTIWLDSDEILGTVTGR